MDGTSNNSEEFVLKKFHLRELPTKTEQEKILSEIGETDESKKRCLDLLREFIKGQNDFYPCTDEDFLLRFLRNTKYDVKKAFTKLRKFYEIQKNNPEIFKFSSQTALTKTHLYKLQASPFRLNDNSTVFIHKFFYTHPSYLSTLEKFYLETLILDEFLENPLNQICGVTTIVDCSDFSFQKLLYYSPKIMKLYVEAMQGIFPVRLKSIYFIKVPPAFHILYNLVYPFFSTKLRNRVHFCKDDTIFKDLHDKIPPELLPEEYGGYLKDSILINVIDNASQKERNFRNRSSYFYS